MRVGIGRPPGRMDPADFVLRDFSPTERKELPFVVDEAADAVESLVDPGPARRAAAGARPEMTRTPHTGGVAVATVVSPATSGEVA